MQILKYIFLFTFIWTAQYACCQPELFIPDLPSTSQMGSFQNYLIINTYKNDTSRLIMYNTDEVEPEGNVIFTTEEKIIDFDVNENYLYFTMVKSGVSTLNVLDLLNLDRNPELIELDGFSPILIAVSNSRCFISGNKSSMPFDLSLIHI